MVSEGTRLLIDKFIRTHLTLFSIQEFLDTITKETAKQFPEQAAGIDGKECATYLVGSDYVFAHGLDDFITYAAAFTGKYFSIKPTNAETEKGLFVAGARCVPFVDPNMNTCELTFRYKGEVLPKKAGEFRSGEAVDMFALLGVEGAPQYIANDPANEGIDLEASDYTLPQRVRLTGSALELARGDRLLCFVSDWDKGVVDIEKIEHTSMQMRHSDIRRQEWYVKFENLLVPCLVSTGPMSSISDQLSILFLNNREALCVKDCGSVAEYLAQSDKVDYASYGVETRLWLKGEEVPVVGPWMGDDANHQELLAELIFMPDFVIEAFITAQLHRNEKDIDAIVNVMELPQVKMTKQERACIALNIASRYDKLQSGYNWFADAEMAELREHTLAFFLEARSLAIDMYVAGISLDNYPQHPLVVYMQIFGNVLKTLNLLQSDGEYDADFKELTEITIASMKSDFEMVDSLLRQAMEENARGGKKDNGF